MKTILITGASRGIGRAIAYAFAKREPSNIIITCSTDTESLQNTCTDIEHINGCTALASVGDISDEAYVKKLFILIEKKYGGLDVLINNAGIDMFGVLQDMTYEQWNRMLAVNLSSVFLCTRAAIPLMLKKHAGSIVNISSVFGTEGASCEAAYSASKGGVNAFTRAMAKELAPCGIRVNALAPGAINTSMNDRLSSDEKAELAGEIPLGRMGSPKEAAACVCFLAEEASYITGQIVTVDGGWM